MIISWQPDKKGPKSLNQAPVDLTLLKSKLCLKCVPFVQLTKHLKYLHLPVLPGLSDMRASSCDMMENWFSPTGWQVVASWLLYQKPLLFGRYHIAAVTPRLQ